jgi:hypothetical protein
MDHIPDDDMPAVAKAAHAVVQEAIDAGVYILAGGLEEQKASRVMHATPSSGSPGHAPACGTS